MKNTDPDILVQQFVDGELSDVEVRDALHRIADDTEARDLLQFELRMTQDLAATRSSPPPQDFADRTMASVAAEAAPSDASASLEAQLRALWNKVTTPVTVGLRPASALVAVLLVGVVAWTVWPTVAPQPTTETISTAQSSSQSVQQASVESSPQDETVWIRFMFTASDADSVAVAGDFSQWDPVPLSPHTVNGETVWTGLVPVPRGEHEYQFVINGERWVTDPLAPVKRSDGFGAKNAVLKI